MRNFGERRLITGLSQKIDVTGTSASCASAFGSETYAIRISAGAGLHYRIFDPSQAGASDSTAVSTDPMLPPQVVEIVPVSSGQKIAAIAATGAWYGNSVAVSVNARLVISEVC